MKHLLIFLAALTSLVAEEPKKTETPPQPPITRESAVTIDGNRIPYQSTTAKLLLKKDDGTPRASIFHVTYERTDIKSPVGRPVVFCFNGGPGSSSVWLHLGGIGPRRVELPGDGTVPPFPPSRIIENPQSILDIADLVFIDPVSTGYSRTEKDTKATDFHGLDEDIESVGDFIRRWTTDHDRWASPKFLLGESYGGIRAAGLAEHLQHRYGMQLNGLIMLSTLLDFRTLQSIQGDGLSHSVFLPAYTSIAFYHKKIQGDRDKLVEESKAFAFVDYAAALLKGISLDDMTSRKIADRLSTLTGISPQVWLDHKLRITPSAFRAELLRSERKTIGRFDARVAWDCADAAAPFAEEDPSYSLAYGAFSTAMLDYLGRDLGWKEDQPYEILTALPWKWNSDNEIINLTGKLSDAMRDNPRLQILVMSGRTDLATPAESMAHSIRQMLDLPEPLRKNIQFTHYDAGHMFYLNPPDLTKSRTDLLNFIHAAALSDRR